MLVNICTLISLGVCTGLFGRFLNYFYLKILCISLLSINFFLFCYACYNTVLKSATTLVIFNFWGTWSVFNFSISFLFDNLSIIMTGIVICVASFVICYAVEYLDTDPHLMRFISVLCFFTVFMLILVSANNFIQFFIGWEGIGLCSFLLISFWFTRGQAVKAGLKAIIINRLGDFCLFSGICIIGFLCFSFDFDIIFTVFPFVSSTSIFGGKLTYGTLVGFLFLLALIAKSAQFGLHTWLPDAMEGPTPVSALLHAATMVTAGIFLFLRCSIIFEYSPSVLICSFGIGLVTVIWAGFFAIYQVDIKRIIAFSTCSQLGLMLILCSLAQYNLALFHLFNHAFFKSLLFLSVGFFIYFTNNIQDIRLLSGQMYNKFLISSLIVNIAALCSIGFLFLSSFYSKDFIIINLGWNFKVDAIFLTGFLILCIFWLTNQYSNILAVVSSSQVIVWKSISNLSFNFKNKLFNFNSGIIMVSCICLLGLLSIIIGWIYFDLFFGLGSNYFLFSLLSFDGYVTTNINYNSEFSLVLYRYLPIISMIISFIFINEFYNIYNQILIKNNFFLYFQIFFYNQGYFNTLNNKILYKFFQFIDLYVINTIEKGILAYCTNIFFINLFYSINLFFGSYFNKNLKTINLFYFFFKWFIISIVVYLILFEYIIYIL